jgi:hypothetical protein
MDSGSKGPVVRSKGQTDHIEYFEEKKGGDHIIEHRDSNVSTSSEDVHYTKPISTAKDLVTEVILAEDDPTLVRTEKSNAILSIPKSSSYSQSIKAVLD